MIQQSAPLHHYTSVSAIRYRQKQPSLVNHSFQFTAVLLLKIKKNTLYTYMLWYIYQISITALKNSGHKTVKQIHRVKS